MGGWAVDAKGRLLRFFRLAPFPPLVVDESLHDAAHLLCLFFRDVATVRAREGEGEEGEK